VAVYNKAHYLNRSLTSILRLLLPPPDLCVICLDDASTDQSMAVIQRFQLIDRRIILHRNPCNLGTHMTRLKLVMLTTTPFLAFLDPDDEFQGDGLPVALEQIVARDADIAEFRCRMLVPEMNYTVIRCWRPPRVWLAKPQQFARIFYGGRVNWHLHRKVFRTDLYKRAIEAMPNYVRHRRILRYEDKLHYAFVIANMTRSFTYIHIFGEMKYYGLGDNSMGEAYQSKADNEENLRFVDDVINRTFGRKVYEPS
jgi:glycosyltransferase involved in cell wall biosynthesis